MKGFRVQLALIVILLAVLGALLHPLALLLAISPFDPRGVIRFMEELRSVIADLLGWGLLSLLAVMAFFVLRGRLSPEARTPTKRERSPANARPIKAAVAITAYDDAAATAVAAYEFKLQPSVVQVIVVDNNSSDDTAALAGAEGATVVHEARQGYGYACIRGLVEGLKSDADVIVLTEGDGTFFAEDLPKFLAYIEHSDLVVGNRVVRDMVDGDSQMDHFFTWGNMAVAMLLRLRFWDGRHLGPAGLMDVGCTYRVIRRDALERILPDLVVGGNTFSPHMLLVAIARNLSVVEIPIRFRRRVGQSKGASQSLWKGLQVGLTMIWHIMTFRLPTQTATPSVEIDKPGAPAQQSQPTVAASMSGSSDK
jgi:hypothetical protein